MEKINAICDFQIVNQLRNDLNTIFSEIDEKQKILSQLYDELVKTHQDKKYTLGIDSFHFQNKLIQMEYDNMKNFFNMIDNYVYCEYYKLHRLLYEFIGKEIKDKQIVDKLLITHKKYPIYKDLEPTKIYDFNITIEINNAIQIAIQELKKYLEDKKKDLSEKKKRSEIGINIHSILHEETYNIIILEERIHMFENHLNTFISHHSKYFSRLTIKLKLMLGIVNEDFHLKQNKLIEKTGTKRGTLRHELPTKEIDTGTDTISVSSSTSTPKSSISEAEATSMRLLIGDASAAREIQFELNTILQHISGDEYIIDRTITEV